MISIRIDDDTVTAGEFVTGRIFWSAEGDRRPRRIIASAVWETAGQGNKVRGVGRAMEYEPREAEATFSFRLLIPHEGPITFKGELVAVVWKLKVRVEQPGFDEFEESEFRVGARSTLGRRPRRSPG
ncbi:MAG: hypothetical protein AABO58_14585 [Acidobacteriota bacterium]